MYFNIYALPVYLTLFFLFFIFVFSLKNRHGKHMYYFILFNLAVTVYTLFYALELSTTSSEFALLFYKLEYIGIPYITPFFLLFVLSFTGNNYLFGKKLAFILYIIPAFTTVSVITNNLHNFHFSDFALTDNGLFEVSKFSKNIGYWIAQAAQLIYMILSLLIMIIHRKKSSKLIRRQINILLIASIIPFIFYVIYILKLMPFGLDPVPFAFLIGSALVFFGLSKNTLLQSDEALREALFENIGSAVVIVNNENKILDFNSTAENKLLLSYSEIEAPADKTLFFWNSLQSSENGNYVTATDPLSLKTFEINATVINNAAGRTTGRVFILNDITERIKTAEALHLTEESYKDIIDNASDMIQSIDIKGNIIFVNSAWKKTLGYTDAEIAKLSIWKILEPNNIEHCRKVFEEIIKGNSENNIQTVFVTKSGKHVNVEGNINARFNNGVLVGTRGIFRNITERVINQENLRKQLANQRLINDISAKFINADYNNINYIIKCAIVDCAKLFNVDVISLFRFVSLSESKVNSFTYKLSSNEITEINTRNIIKESFPWWKRQVRENHFVIVEDVSNMPNEAKTEQLHYTKLGIKSLLSIPMVSDHKVLGFIGYDSLSTIRKWEEDDISTLQIITEIIARSVLKAEAEEMLRQSKEQFQLAVNGSNDGIWDWDIVSNKLFLSPKWKKMVGYEDYELKNDFSTFESLIHPEDKQRVLDYINEYLKGNVKKYKVDFRFKHKAGYFLWISARGEGITDAQGNIIRMAGSHTDITKDFEEKEALEKLLSNSELLIKSSSENLYEKITENLRELSGANFAAFNLLNESDNTVRTISFAGIPDKLESGMNLLGFDLKNKVWPEDPIIKDIINRPGVHEFESLSEISKNNLAKSIVKIISSTFRVGKVAIVRITKETKIIGYFTIVFTEFNEIKNKELLEIYANYVGLFLDRNNSITEVIDGERRYRELIENAGTAIVISRANQIIFANKRSIEFFGYNDTEIYNKKVSDLLLKEDVDKLISGYKKLALSNSAVTISPVRIIDVNNNLRWLDLNAVKISWDKKDAVLTFANDITDRMNYEIALKNKEDLLRAIANSTDELLKHDNYSDAIPIVFENLGQSTLVDRVYLFSNNVDENGESTLSTSQKYEWNSGIAEPQINNPDLQNIPFQTIGDFIKPLSELKPFISNVNSLPESSTKEILETQNIKSLLVLPLKVDGKFWGFIGFDDCQNERTWTSDEFSILQSFAGSLSYAIERQILLEKLNTSVTEAEKAAKAKSDFLANMSHEIRTPLNGVIGFSDLLTRTELADTQLHYAKSINQSAVALLDLINDILDFSKIEAGKLELNYEPVNLHTLTSQIIDIVKFSAHQKKLEILLNVSHEMPGVIIADYVRLRQVLLNLLSNAIKFTDTGEIEISVYAKPSSDKEKYIYNFQIRDTGIGINEDLQSKILESFTQADSSITKKYGGTGLGLTIVNRLLHLMKSSLHIESDQNKGSIFSFELETKFVTQESTSFNLYEEINGFGKVLIIDDNLNNIRILEDMLKTMQIDSISFNDPCEAYDKVDHVQSSLAIIDYNMPKLDGISLIRKIRHEKMIDPAELKIILLHSSSEVDQIPDMIEKNEIDMELTKPLRLNQLENALRNITKKTVIKKIGLGKKIDQKFMNDFTPDNSVYKVMIAEDNATNMILAVHILKILLPDAEIIEAYDGNEAVRLFDIHLPDLIFMDIHMPVMSGYEATKEIRKKPGAKNIPIIALTAGTLAEEKQKSIDSGMNDYISKPILVDTINNILAKYKTKSL